MAEVAAEAGQAVQQALLQQQLLPEQEGAGKAAKSEHATRLGLEVPEQLQKHQQHQQQPQHGALLGSGKRRKRWEVSGDAGKQGPTASVRRRKRWNTGSDQQSAAAEKVLVASRAASSALDIEHQLH
eukprot:scaffold290964_cov15-Tisochrysis_lutea.AAC.1